MAATFPGVCAVVPAAGFGRRMQTECPKQYLSIGNKTILEHAVAALLAVGGILAAPVRDTMKRAEPDKTAIAHTVDRNDLWHALTPQFFPRELLVDCLTRALNEGATITDEASALEYCGFHPQLVAGRADNIKVTRPEDLALAEFYLTRSRHQEKA